jgi:hypothetical protein
MATKFPSFSQGLAQDPTTRRIWYGIATAHDFESHDGMTEEKLYQKLFSTHFGHLAIIGLWVSGNLFHIAWQGNFEQWVSDPLHVRPIAHAIWDPHFGQGAIDAFTQAGASSPVNIAYSGLYHWFYTIGTARDDACRDKCSGRSSREEFLSMQSFDTVGPSPHMLSSCGIAREDACRDMYAGLCASKEVFLRHSSTPGPLHLTGRAWQTECIDVAVKTS